MSNYFAGSAGGAGASSTAPAPAAPAPAAASAGRSAGGPDVVTAHPPLPQLPHDEPQLPYDEPQPLSQHV